MSTEIDNKISEAKKLLDKKKKNIPNLSKKRWKTKKLITVFGGKVNIEIETDLTLLSRLRHWIGVSVTAANSASEAWGHKVPCDIHGYPAEDWISDIDLRAKQIIHKDEIEKIEKLEKQIKTLMSEDQKREMQYNEIMEELNS